MTTSSRTIFAVLAFASVAGFVNVQTFANTQASVNTQAIATTSSPADQNMRATGAVAPAASTRADSKSKANRVAMFCWGECW